MTQQPETFYVVEFVLDHENGGATLFMTKDSHGYSRPTTTMMKAEVFHTLAAAQRLIQCYHNPYGPQHLAQGLFGITQARPMGSGTFTVVEVTGSSWSNLKSAPIWQQHIAADYSTPNRPLFTTALGEYITRD